MAKQPIDIKTIRDHASKDVGPNKDFFNPKKRSGNPTKGGEIFGKHRKPKLGK